MIYQAVCTSFKKELFEAIHDFGADTFRLALYTEDADLNEETTAYSATDEVAGTGYTAGGFALTAVAPATSGTAGITGFEDLTTGNLTVSGVRGGLIYNASKANRAVAVLDFGRILTKSGQPLVVTFPPSGERTSILRVR